MGKAGTAGRPSSSSLGFYGSWHPLACITASLRFLTANASSLPGFPRVLVFKCPVIVRNLKMTFLPSPAPPHSNMSLVFASICPATLTHAPLSPFPQTDCNSQLIVFLRNSASQLAVSNSHSAHNNWFFSVVSCSRLFLICTLCKCPPLVSPSQYCCHLLPTYLQITPLPSDFKSLTCMWCVLDTTVCSFWRWHNFY